jgi:hypothetical protein
MGEKMINQSHFTADEHDYPPDGDFKRAPSSLPKVAKTSILIKEGKVYDAGSPTQDRKKYALQSTAVPSMRSR